MLSDGQILSREGLKSSFEVITGGAIFIAKSRLKVEEWKREINIRNPKIQRALKSFNPRQLVSTTIELLGLSRGKPDNNFFVEQVLDDAQMLVADISQSEELSMDDVEDATSSYDNSHLIRALQDIKFAESDFFGMYYSITNGALGVARCAIWIEQSLRGKSDV